MKQMYRYIAGAVLTLSVSVGFLAMSGPDLKNGLSSMLSGVDSPKYIYYPINTNSSSVVGGGAGDHLYYVPSYLHGGQKVTISDASGNNAYRININDIAYGLKASNALRFIYKNGAEITILNADKFSYQIMTESTSAISFTLLEQVGSTYGMLIYNLYSITMGSPGIVGGGLGNHMYIPSNLGTNQKVTISDTSGNNAYRINLNDIAHGLKVSNAVKFTYKNGAEITILNADKFNYVVNDGYLLIPYDKMANSGHVPDTMWK